MRTKIYSLFALIALSISVNAQGVGINETGSTPDPSAGLDVNFVNKGFLPPRMTVAQRDAITNPAKGLMVYNTTFGCLQVNEGTPATPHWICITGIADGSIATLDCVGATNNGTLTSGEAASGVSSEIAYTGGNGGPHGGQIVNSTGVTGLTATLASGSFASSGTLIFNISGTPSSGGTASFAINIGGQSCTLERNVISFWPAGYVHCNPSNITVISDVTNSTTGKTWMDRNLGANRVAISSSDIQSYGYLYQWGRFPDGHQCVNRYSGDGVTTSGTTSTNATTAVPNAGNAWDGLFINETVTPEDWLIPQDNNLWQGVNGTNNPCPLGYRLPTQAEMNAERATWSSSNAAGAFASQLKLPLAGYRTRGGGAVLSGGNLGFYWLSSLNGEFANDLYMASGWAFVGGDRRANGNSVRCIKD